MDLLGVGFGPANLALAVAVHEHNQAGGRRLSQGYLERSPRFGWHRDMLIEDATMQVSFLKDLATLRDPTSPFSFLCYLRDRGRLVDFVNHKTLLPTRIEFHDYLEWAAARLPAVTEYGTRAVEVRPVSTGDEVTHLDVVAERVDTGETVVRRTRNLVVATGLRPALPPGIQSSARIWHSSELLGRLAGLTERPRRFVVVGAGQSAAEIVAHLHRTYGDAEVHAVFSRYGYSPADDSPFANRVFDPAAVDHFHHAPPSVKDAFFSYHANTNYSVVDGDLIEDLYARAYRESVTGQRRLHVHNMSRVLECRADNGGVRVRVEFQPDGSRVDLDADHVVYATGYRPDDALSLLGEAAALCKQDSAGRPRMQRDYRVCTGPQVTCGIYLQGGTTEHSHGLSASLLSNVAVRAGEIVSSVLADQSITQAVAG